MLLKKNIKVGNKKSIFFFILFLFNITFLCELRSESNLEGHFTDIKILDKINSKNQLIKLTRLSYLFDIFISRE